MLFTLHYAKRDGSFLTCTRAGLLLTSDSPLHFTDSGLELTTKIVSLSNAYAYWCVHLCYYVYQLRLQIRYYYYYSTFLCAKKRYQNCNNYLRLVCLTVGLNPHVKIQ
jgi:hypothetical protein